MLKQLAGIIERRRFYLAVLGGIVVVYLVMSIASAATKRPWSDEGWFANPPFNLITRGSMGTNVLEPTGWLKGIDEHTYWVAPLHLVTQAGWYKVFGFGLIQMRALSAAFGLLALIGLFYMVRALSGDKRIALLTFALLAFDYIFITGASFGRMDMMCAGLGFAGLGSYLWLREKNFNLAVIVSHAFVVASGMTHFMGLLYLAGLIFLTFYFDRERLRLIHLALAAVPYLIGATGWGLYIMQSPDAFLSQFKGNAATDDRLKVLTAPWQALKAEVTERYLVAYGLGSHLKGHAGPIALKALVLLAYLVALAGALATRAIRNHKGYRALLILIAIFFFILTVLDGQKLAWYLVHIVPLYTAILAVWISWCWEHRRVPRPVIALCVCGIMLLQVGGVLFKMRFNSYREQHLPAANFLKQHTTPQDLIFGDSSLAFDIGYDRNLKDDYRLGFFTGKRADFIVIEEIYEDNFARIQFRQPDLYQHIQKVLSEYEVVYDREFYKIYARRAASNDAGDVSLPFGKS